MSRGFLHFSQWFLRCPYRLTTDPISSWHPYYITTRSNCQPLFQKNCARAIRPRGTDFLVVSCATGILSIVRLKGFHVCQPKPVIHIYHFLSFLCFYYIILFPFCQGVIYLPLAFFCALWRTTTLVRLAFWNLT